MVLICSVPPTVNSGFTLVKIMEASGKSALPLMIIGARSSFAHSSSNLPIPRIVHSSPCCFILVSKLRILQHCGVSDHKTRVHHLRELRYPPLIGLKGSQPRGLYYGVCSEQHPSNRREFRDHFRQFLVVTSTLRFFSQFMVRCGQSRNSCDFAVCFVVGS